MQIGLLTPTNPLEPGTVYGPISLRTVADYRESNFAIDSNYIFSIITRGEDPAELTVEFLDIDEPAE